MFETQLFHIRFPYDLTTMTHFFSPLSPELYRWRCGLEHRSPSLLPLAYGVVLTKDFFLNARSLLGSRSYSIRRFVTFPSFQVARPFLFSRARHSERTVDIYRNTELLGSSWGPPTVRGL